MIWTCSPKTITTLTLALSLSVSACTSDEILDPERSGDALATLLTPGDHAVAGAMVELWGVDDVILTDGEVVSRVIDDRLRVILMLDEPGLVDFGVRMTPGGTQITGVVLQVIGADDGMIESVGGYSLEFDR